MVKNLVIVESPAKAKTIEKFLGEGFVVKSCFGHVRDLVKEKNGVDIANNFSPIYEISTDKRAIVSELKKYAKDAEYVWLASDEDREGEAISWHLKEVLNLNKNKTRRITFHEITKNAILKAVQNPRDIDQNLVDSQQTRRILDRLVGFEISPVLWKKLRPNLSAGRVQSVAVRLIVEREREIDLFNSNSSYKVTGNFVVSNADNKALILKSELAKNLKNEEEALEFLNICKPAEFSIGNLEKKSATRTPAPPFTTSTLQQEASRKLRFSVGKTMLVAQKLYEAGNITYMRTDSVNLAASAIDEAKSTIISSFGKDYSKVRQYKTKTAGAQEAHEAIRPTYFNNTTIEGSKDEQALYQLIWKRAIASQMADAVLERNIATIDVTTSEKKFIAQGEVILFDGFLKVYTESSDDDDTEKDSSGMLPPLTIGQKLGLQNITATQRFTRPSARYTEASLVKKLEELGIGRPSTYAPTISTIQKRGYIVKEDRLGVERTYIVLRLNSNKKIEREVKSENFGTEKSKLFPLDIALLVTDFLQKEFSQIMDYQFTASMEKDLDDIANGSVNGPKILGDFYFPFHQKVLDTTEKSERITGERILGTDQKSGKLVSVRIAKFGPVAQMTVPGNPDDKPQYAGLRTGQKLESISLEEAISLFDLPRKVGEYEGKEVIASVGRFGPYLSHASKFYSLSKVQDPHSIDLDTSIEVIEERKKKLAESVLKEFPNNNDYQILQGRWGPYLKAGKNNVKIPKGTDYNSLSFEECEKLALLDLNVKKSLTKTKKPTEKATKKK